MKRLGLGLALKYVRTNYSRELTTELYAHECARGVTRDSGIVRNFHVTHHVRVFPSDLVIEPKGIVVHYYCYPPGSFASRPPEWPRHPPSYGHVIPQN